MESWQVQRQSGQRSVAVPEVRSEVGSTRRIQWWQREGLKSAFKTLNHHVPGDEEGETNCSAVHLWSLQCMRSSPLVTAVNVNVVSFSNLEETKKSNAA